MAPSRSPVRQGRPTPASNWLVEPFWEGCRRGELRIQRCGECQRWFFVPQIACPGCHSESWEWTRVSGRGQIYSFTVVHRPATPAFEAPYVLAIIELDEGLMMMSNVIGCDAADVKIGMAVVVEFEASEGGAAIPLFRPDDGRDCS